MLTKVEVVYLTPALMDFEEIGKYHITQAGAASARKIYRLMESTISRLEDFPLMGQMHPDPLLRAQGYRKLVLNDTYVAIYRFVDGKVLIYRIVNGRSNYPSLLK